MGENFYRRKSRSRGSNKGEEKILQKSAKGAERGTFHVGNTEGIFNHKEHRERKKEGVSSMAANTELALGWR
jgi:hypothetical protein